LCPQAFEGRRDVASFTSIYQSNRGGKSAEAEVALLFDDLVGER
jgi:hypothetical protein